VKTVSQMVPFALLALVAGCGGGLAAPEEVPGRARGGGVRQPVDMVGYTHTAEGIRAVIDLALEN
jgi:hypothetical protein